MENSPRFLAIFAGWFPGNQHRIRFVKAVRTRMGFKRGEAMEVLTRSLEEVAAAYLELESAEEARLFVEEANEAGCVTYLVDRVNDPRPIDELQAILRSYSVKDLLARKPL